MTLVLASGLTLVGCTDVRSDVRDDSGTHAGDTVRRGPTLQNERRLRTRAPKSTVLYEHRDHRQLPIGTRIYYRGRMEMIVRPGERGPTGPPDIVIIP